MFTKPRCPHCIARDKKIEYLTGASKMLSENLEKMRFELVYWKGQARLKMEGKQPNFERQEGTD